MAEWKPLSVLPNVELEDAVGGDLIVLVPPHDPKIVELSRAHPNLKKFLTSLTDAFGIKLQTSVIIAHGEAPRVAVHGNSCPPPNRDRSSLWRWPICRCTPRGHQKA